MQSEIERLNAENDHLRKLLGIDDNKAVLSEFQSADTAETPHHVLRSADRAAACDTCPPKLHTWEAGSHDLNKEQISRYSRQIILPSFGPAGETASPCFLFYLRT